jgi:hypothetical protein
VNETPLEALCRLAPRRLTLEDIAERMARRGVHRGIQALSNFRSGRVKTPSAEFVAAFAWAIGTTVEAVLDAHRRTRRAVYRKTTLTAGGRAA